MYCDSRKVVRRYVVHVGCELNETVITSFYIFTTFVRVTFLLGTYFYIFTLLCYCGHVPHLNLNATHTLWLWRGKNPFLILFTIHITGKFVPYGITFFTASPFHPCLYEVNSFKFLLGQRRVPFGS